MSESGRGKASGGDAEVPEADRLEHAEPVAPEEADGNEEGQTPPSIGLEVPEADALEQAREVPLDEDEER
jgi:hypothetical protein